MGGMQGFGTVDVSDSASGFHEAWEGRVFAISLILPAQGVYNLDEFRWSREQIPPREYLESSYFELWLTAMERLVCEKGLATREELAARARDGGGEASRRPRSPELTERMLRIVHQGLPALKEGGPPRLRKGDRVRARNFHPRGHTRLPRYVRGRRGVVDLVHGRFELPDESAAGGHVPEPLYTVRFDATELWGTQARPGDGVRVDLWESYLEREDDKEATRDG